MSEPRRPVSPTRAQPRLRSRILASFVGAAAIVSGCASVRPAPLGDLDLGPPLGPIARWGRPEPDSTERAELAEARRLASLGRRDEALAVGRKLMERAPWFVDGERFVQDLTIHSVGDVWLRERCESRIRARPDDADTWYFMARAESDPARQTSYFEEALRRDPLHPYARLGRALSLDRAGDRNTAEREAWRSAGSAPWLSLPWLYIGSTLLSTGEPVKAERFLREAAAREPLDARPWVALASAADDAGKPDAAADAAVEALRRAPGEPAVLLPVAKMLERTGSPEQLEAALKIADRALPECGMPLAVQLLRGRLLYALGRSDEAVGAFREAQHLGAWYGDVSGPLRRALCRAGRYSEAIDAALSSLPSDEEGDDCRPAWQELRVAGAGLRIGVPGAHLRAAKAMLGVGWIDEARRLLADPAASADPACEALAARARAFRGFLDELAVCSRDLRRRSRRGEKVELGEALGTIGKISRERLGFDITEGAAVKSYPFIGSYAGTTQSSGAYRDVFESFGLTVVVGQRAGTGTDVMAGRLIRRVRGRTERVLGETIRFDDHLIDGEGLPDGLTGLRSGLAGVTLDDMVFVQLDALLKTPRPVDQGFPYRDRVCGCEADLRALDTPSEVAHRIESRLQVRGHLATDLLDAVRRHEYVHVRDAALLLPVLSNLPRALGFGLRHGFDGEEMEQTLEGRAAIGALVESREPRAALASLLAFLPLHEAGSPHAAGYRVHVLRAIEEILRDPDAFPSIRAGINIVQQMDRLTSDEVRELGRRLCAREF